MTLHRDPLTGRPYTVDADGRSRWVYEPVTQAFAMPSHANPPPKPGPATAPPPARPTRRRPGRVAWAGGTGIVGVIVGVGIGSAGGTPPAMPTPAVVRTVTAPARTVTAVARTSTTPPVVAAKLTRDDYLVKVKILSKQCFGSAGCNVRVRLVLGVAHPEAQGVAAEVTVTVTGDESGPLIETVSVTSAGDYVAPELIVSTARSTTKIVPRVTGVERA
jgi:hypothetical protein